MKRLSKLVVLSLFAVSASTTSCQRSSDEVRADTQSAGRHVARGVKTLGGKHGESRAVRSRDEFHASDAKANDFIALDDSGSQNLSIRDSDSLPQAKNSPGELGSGIPGIDAFRDPSQDPMLASIFQNLHFDYNSSLIKNDEDMATVEKIAQFMKSHPNIYVFVEGHCDNRGPAAYNLALGANRANAVRSAIAKDGANPDNLFTISYGKERPLVDGESEDFFRLNRRAQFRVWER